LAHEHDQPYDAEATDVGVTSEAVTLPEATRLAQMAASANATVLHWIPSQPYLFSLAIKGKPFTLIKNWEFGTNGNIRDYDDLSREFQYHDQFNTIANGTNYGAVTVAANSQTAIAAPGLGLPNDRQPVEDPARPYREFTANTMRAYVRPLSRTQSTGSTSRHDVGNGSITSKWTLPTAGKALGHDIAWETRVRMPNPMRGYWFALWTAGRHWDGGAEMDVVESFGTQYVSGDAFHSDSVGGTNLTDYSDWFGALTKLGVAVPKRRLSDWHVWTWLYAADDSYTVYYDGRPVQRGNIHWTLGGAQNGEMLDMSFLFDFSWGHNQVSEVNVELPAAAFQLTYEIDYSRVWIR
jgi:hypothetical protein